MSVELQSIGIISPISIAAGSGKVPESVVTTSIKPDKSSDKNFVSSASINMSYEVLPALSVTCTLPCPFPFRDVLHYFSRFEWVGDVAQHDQVLSRALCSLSASLEQSDPTTGAGPDSSASSSSVEHQQASLGGDVATHDLEVVQTTASGFSSVSSSPHAVPRQNVISELQSLCRYIESLVALRDEAGRAAFFPRPRPAETVGRSKKLSGAAARRARKEQCCEAELPGAGGEGQQFGTEGKQNAQHQPAVEANHDVHISFLSSDVVGVAVAPGSLGVDSGAWLYDLPCRGRAWVQALPRQSMGGVRRITDSVKRRQFSAGEFPGSIAVRVRGFVQRFLLSMAVTTDEELQTRSFSVRTTEMEVLSWLGRLWLLVDPVWCLVPPNQAKGAPPPEGDLPLGCDINQPAPAGAGDQVPFSDGDERALLRALCKVYSRHYVSLSSSHDHADAVGVGMIVGGGQAEDAGGPKDPILETTPCQNAVAYNFVEVAAALSNRLLMASDLEADVGLRQEVAGPLLDLLEAAETLCARAATANSLAVLAKLVLVANKDNSHEEPGDPSLLPVARRGLAVAMRNNLLGSSAPQQIADLAEEACLSALAGIETTRALREGVSAISVVAASPARQSRLTLLPRRRLTRRPAKSFGAMGENLTNRDRPDSLAPPNFTSGGNSVNMRGYSPALVEGSSAADASTGPGRQILSIAGVQVVGPPAKSSQGLRAHCGFPEFSDQDDSSEDSESSAWMYDRSSLSSLPVFSWIGPVALHEQFLRSELKELARSFDTLTARPEALAATAEQSDRGEGDVNAGRALVARLQALVSYVCCLGERRDVAGYVARGWGRRLEDVTDVIKRAPFSVHELPSDVIAEALNGFVDESLTMLRSSNNSVVAGPRIGIELQYWLWRLWVAADPQWLLLDYCPREISPVGSDAPLARRERKLGGAVAAALPEVVTILATAHNTRDEEETSDALEVGAYLCNRLFSVADFRATPPSLVCPFAQTHTRFPPLATLLPALELAHRQGRKRARFNLLCVLGKMFRERVAVRDEMDADHIFSCVGQRELESSPIPGDSSERARLRAEEARGNLLRLFRVILDLAELGGRGGERGVGLVDVVGLDKRTRSLARIMCYDLVESFVVSDAGAGRATAEGGSLGADGSFAVHGEHARVLALSEAELFADREVRELLGAKPVWGNKSSINTLASLRGRIEYALKSKSWIDIAEDSDEDRPEGCRGVSFVIENLPCSRPVGL